MKNFDTFDIDFRPGQRRSTGGLSESRGLQIVYRGDLGSTKQSQTSSALNLQTTAQGGGSGSGTANIGAQSSGNTVNISSVDPSVVDSAFQFGAETETGAGQIIGQSNQTIEDIAGKLADLTANATPQTPAAAAELSAGGTPFTGAALPNNVVVIATIGAFALAAVFYFVTRK